MLICDVIGPYKPLMTYVNLEHLDLKSLLDCIVEFATIAYWALV